MCPANVPPGERVPEVSPIFPDLRVERIAKLEVHIQYEDEEGDKCWAEVEGLPVFASWADIKRKAGGGHFKVAAKGKGKAGFIGNDQKTLDGPPKYLNKLLAKMRRDREEARAGYDDEDAQREERTLVYGIVRQQSEILPAAFEANTTALVQMGDKYAAQLVAMSAQMAGMVLQMSALNTTHAGEVKALHDGYGLQLKNRDDRIAKLEADNIRLTEQNAGWLRERASARPSSEAIAVVKELAPELPKVKEFLRGAGRAFRGEDEGGGAAPKQLAATNGAATGGAPAAATNGSAAAAPGGRNLMD